MTATIKLGHITISYPPDYDGELHIACVANPDYVGRRSPALPTCSHML
jgi:hypothetical protein